MDYKPKLKSVKDVFLNDEKHEDEQDDDDEGLVQHAGGIENVKPVDQVTVEFFEILPAPDTGYILNALPINTTTTTAPNVNDSGGVPLGDAMNDTKHMRPSRDLRALQKSHTESKILTEFVNDTAIVQSRKLRTRDNLQNSSKRNGKLDVTITKIHEHFNNSVRGGKIIKRKRSEYRLIPLKTDSPKSRYASSRIASADTNDFALYCSEMKRRRSEGAIFTGDGSSKRTNMRSENPEFKQKHKDFLQQVFRTSKTPDSHNDSTESTSSKSTKLYPRRLNKEPKAVDVATDFQEIMDSGDADDNLLAIEENSMEKYLKGAWQPPPKEGADSFCWKCHAGRVVHSCSKCIRSFHSSCTKIILLSTHNWVCNECIAVENALHNPKRYRRNEISVDLLSQLLLYVLKIMRCSKVHQSLMQYLESESRYNRYLINSVTFSTLQEKIEKKVFRCAEEFLNETKWILHNVFILTNRRTNKIITAARSLVKTCRQETAEIDACPECYLKAHTRTDWFVDVCAHPHLLVWAKLKGFPYWPAKAMGISQNSLVCVRFFGEHTRALVPVKECYLYSKEDPNSQTGRRAARELAACVQEVEQHIERIKSKVGGFQYPLSKTPYEPNDEMQQLQQMMPGVQEYIKRQQQFTTTKPSLQYKIYKTSDNHLSIVPKANTPDITNTTIDLDPKESSLNTNKKSRAELREDNQPMNDAMMLKKPEKLIIKNVPPNYEVITKPITDDNNSSRLSKFILKRKSPAPHELNKSLASGAKDKLDDTDGQHSMPKLTKWQPANHEASSSSKAEKAPASSETVNRSNGEEAKQVKKQDEEQPKQRLPIIILKTNSINISTASDVAGKHQMVRPILEIKKEVLTGFEDEMNKEAIQTKQQKETTARPVNQRDSDNQNTMKAKESNTLNIVPVKEVITGDTKLKANAIVTTTITNTTTTTTTTELLPLLCDIKEEVFSDISEESNIVMNEPCNKTYPTAVSNQTNHPPSNSLPNKADLMQMGNNAVSKMPMTSTKTQNNPVISSVGSISYNSNNYGGSTMLSNSKRGTFKGIPYGPLPASAFPPTTAGQGTQPIMKTIAKLTDSGSILQQQPAQVKVGSNRSTHTSQTIQDDKASARGSILQNVNSVISASSTTASSPCLVPLATTVSITLPGTSLQTIDSIHQRGRTANNFVMVNIPVDVATSRIDNSTNSIISSVPALPITAVSKTSPSSTFLTAIAHNGVTATVSTTTIATISAISSGNSSSLVTTITPIMSTTNSLPFGLVSNATTVTTTTSSNKTIPCLSNNLTINNSNNNNNNSSSNNNNNNINNNNNNNASSNNNIPPSIIAMNSNMTSINGANFMPLSLNPLNMRAPPPLAGLSSGNITAPPPAAYSGSTNLMTNYTIPVPKSDSLNGNIFIRSESFPKLLAQPTNQIVMQNDANDSVRTSRFCKKLNENAQKLGEYFRMIMEDTIAQLSQGESPSLEAKIAMLTMELERTKQQHQVELLRAIEETKRKQWCSQCGQEAKLYCCWNTSYCGYPCQKLHWLNHEQNCAQTRNISGDISNTMQAQQIVAAVATTTGASTTVATAIVTATSSYNTSTQTHINTIASQLPSYTQQSQQPVPQTRSYITHHQQQQQQQQHQQQQQTERHHMVPTTNNTTTATTMNMNKSGITMKKTKVVNKNNANTQIMSTTSTATPAPTSTHPLATAPIHNTEVLKLPTNTFLRPVTTNAKMNSNQQNNAQQHIRCNTTYSIPVQNYNVPVPITTAPSTYTIVQQGNNWVLRNPGISTLPHQQTKAANSSAVTQTTGVGGNTTRTIRRNGGGRGKFTTLKPKI